MEILLFIASIYCVAGVAWLVNKIFGVNICPICAGVLLSWILSLLGIYSGVLTGENWMLVAVLGMGGSAVGIAYQFEKKYLVLSGAAVKIWWKLIFIPAGFSAAYGIATANWVLFWGALGIASATILFFLYRIHRRSPEENERIRSLEDKMKDCC